MNAGFFSTCGLMALAIPLGVSAGEIVGLGAELPEVEFDLPAQIIARDVTPADYAATHPGGRLVQIELPVSVVVYQGDVKRVEEVIVEIDGGDSQLRVHSYSPGTQLESEFAKEIEVKKTTEEGQAFDATLGVALPVPGAGAVARVTPSVEYHKNHRDSECETQYRKPPKEAVVVSGTTNGRRGAYFKLRKSSQSTLEGEHLLSVTFAAPEEWRGGGLSVTSIARGERSWLFVKERTNWGETTKPVRLRLASYEVAKPVVETAE